MDAAIETGARQQALSEFLSLIEGRDLLLIHADKQIRQLQRRLAEKQAIICLFRPTVYLFLDQELIHIATHLVVVLLFFNINSTQPSIPPG